MEPELSGLTLFQEEVARAKATPPGERLLEGPRLFDRACALMKAGIRHRHPDANEDDVLQRLLDQLDTIRQLEVRRERG